MLERHAAQLRIQIREYFTNNGVYTVKVFGHSLKRFDQTIKHSGVGGHHHNGLAENAIKNVTKRARIMIFHAAIRWPEVTIKTL